MRELIHDETRTIRHPEEFLDALGAITGDTRYEEVREQIRERIEKEVVTMCIIAEELENKGMERGIATGTERGIATGTERGIATGTERGIAKGIETGIEAFILDYLEDGKTRPQILDRLERRFSLSSEKAAYYYDKYAQ